MVIRKLILADLAAHRTRAALTVGAIALAVSLIVSVTSGYASIEAAIVHYYNVFMGPVDAQVTKANDPHGGVPVAAEALLKTDPAVKSAVGRLETQNWFADGQGKPVPSGDAIIVGIDGDSDVRVGSLQVVDGQWFAGRTGDGAVIDQVVQELLKAKIGDWFEVPGPGGRLRLRIVGVVHKPTILAQKIQTIYLPIETLQRFEAGPATQPGGEPPDWQQYTRIFITLNRGADAAAFAYRIYGKLHDLDPTLDLQMHAQNRSQLDHMLSAIRIPSYVGSSVSMVAAAFIIFTTLSMGVLERQRALAMLRAIGGQRAVLGQLVVGEGLALVIGGLVIGVPLGLLWVELLAWHFDTLFTAGVVVSAAGILFSCVCSLIAGLMASLLPAVSAMRLSPLEAMAPLAQPARTRVPAWTVVAGLLMVSLDPVLLFGAPTAVLRLAGSTQAQEIGRNISFFGHVFLGVPALMLGFFLLAPLVVRVLDLVASWPLALLFAVRPALLKQQLSAGLWRAAGTGAALMVGLAVLIALQTAGRTAMAGWKIPDKFPDIFIATYKPGGLNPAEQEKLRHIKGIHAHEIMPIAIASPELGTNFFALAGVALAPRATMFFGVDPNIAFDLMELDFRDGNAKDAQRMLRLNRHVIVTQEFKELKGLKVGDTLQLRTPRHGLVDYTVAGVVWSPGIDVIVSAFDVGRQFDQRTAASVFGTLHDAAEDFGVTGCYLFAANLEPGASKAKVLKQVQDEVGAWGMHAGDVRQIKADIRDGFMNLLLLASTIAIAAMAVASLGVSNTVMAAVRSRRWQFGVLRSIGVTRAGLVRLVLAESALLGLVGSVLGVAAGLELALNERQVDTVVLGYHPPMSVPWGIVALGAAAVIAIALLASIWPSVSTARQTPLALLQAGRASA